MKKLLIFILFAACDGRVVCKKGVSYLVIDRAYSTSVVVMYDREGKPLRCD